MRYYDDGDLIDGLVSCAKLQWYQTFADRTVS